MRDCLHTFWKVPSNPNYTMIQWFLHRFNIWGFLECFLFHTFKIIPPRKKKPHELCREAKHKQRMPTASSEEILTWSLRFCFCKQIFTFSLPGVTCHWPKVTLPFKAASCYFTSYLQAARKCSHQQWLHHTHRQHMLLHLCLLSHSLSPVFLWSIHLLLFSSHLLAQLRLAVTHLKYSTVELPSANII